ncbi:hypothetical protein Cst_c12270 [Thermoclostridium stercorarium subsp. stercorarium DSM 8532]|uniref:Uncharacterized protein n=1 Tax=Thermoclostridium stercorarium (strain ATCC 35414 / DSM 8532 / NCIMB 11754) TaxID=1121335 RepID=L7VN93_THES1|nr:hypothetical protein Cst_c12270 [Thermoclostridium stercorarium subsp. stercorarium DSM 8532]
MFYRVCQYIFLKYFKTINCNIKCREKFGKSIAYWNKFYTSYRHFYG